MDSAESTSCRSRVEIETEEQRDKRLQRRRERERERRASESEEMREDRLSKRRAGDRARRASESAEVREKRLSKWRAGDSARRAINAFPECRFAQRTLFSHHFLLRNQCANLTQRPGTPVRHYSLRLAPTMIIICLVGRGHFPTVTCYYLILLQMAMLSEAMCIVVLCHINIF